MPFRFFRSKVPKTSTAKRPWWRVEFTSNGVLVHGDRVEAASKTDAIHRATARATASLAMRGGTLKYESVVASLA